MPASARSRPRPESAAAATGAAGLRLARQLRREGRADEAARLYRDLAVRPGGQAAARLELAHLHLAQGRHAAALELYAGLAGTAEALAAGLGRVRALRLRHRYADAEGAARDLVAELPNEPEVALEAGRLALACEAYTVALGRLEVACASAPGRPEPVESLLDAQAALGRFPAAEALLDELAAAEPLAARWRAAGARVAEARGDLALALRRWNGVLEVEGHSLPARLAIGRLLNEVGRWRETAAAYRDLVETHPRAVEPVVQLARLALRQGQTAEALAWLDRARELGPADDRLNRDIARVYVEDGRTREARRFARQLLAARPESPEVRITVAWIEELSGAAPRAIRLLEDALRDHPQSFPTALKLARLLDREGEPRRALDAVERVRAVHPGRCYGLEQARVDLLLGLGDVARAGEAIDALLLDHGGRVDLQRRVARLEVAHGRVEAARRRWARLTRLDPHVSGPPTSLHRLDRRPLAPAPGEVRLFTRLRNQAHRLPWFLDFHRAQGVGRFLVVDNGSDDGSREHLLDQPDVHLWLTTDSYAEFGGGMRWLNELLEEHGAGHWCLTVDVDEVLAYPHAERLRLPALARHLEAQGAEALFAFMLDMYPDGPVAEARCGPGEPPFRACPLFDRAGYVTRPNPDFPFKLVAGGLMARLLYGGRQDATYLHKVPLVRWRPGLRYILSMHHLHPVRLAAETGALLHFKYLSDLPAKAATEAERKQYGHGGKRYAALSALFARDAGLSLRSELSERLTGTAQLVSVGHMRSSPALDAFAAAEAGPPLAGWAALAGDGP